MLSEPTEQSRFGHFISGICELPLGRRANADGLVLSKRWLKADNATVQSSRNAVAELLHNQDEIYRSTLRRKTERDKCPRPPHVYRPHCEKGEP